MEDTNSLSRFTLDKILGQTDYTNRKTKIVCTMGLFSLYFFLLYKVYSFIFLINFLLKIIDLPVGLLRKSWKWLKKEWLSLDLTSHTVTIRYVLESLKNKTNENYPQTHAEVLGRIREAQKKCRNKQVAILLDTKVF